MGTEPDRVGCRMRRWLVVLLLVSCHQAFTEDIPLETCDKLLVIQVRVSEMKFLFLLDTAAVSMLNLKSFAHGEPSRANVKSWNGTVETDAQDTAIGDLAVGQHHFKNLRLTAVDLSAIGRACGRRVDGILGIDLLQQLGATVDVKNHTVHLPDVETVPAQVAELERQLAACQQAFDRADEAVVTDCLDPQVVLFTFSGDIHGRQAVIEYYRERYFRPVPRPQVAVAPRAYHPIGDAIWVEYDLRVVSKGQLVQAQGTMLCQKLDGKWRIVLKHNSSPAPPLLDGAAAGVESPESKN
jgi:hypothetical protein